MLIAQLNRDQAEKIFISVKNVEATTVTTGMGVRFVGGAAAEIVSTDGVNVVKSGLSPQFAGIASQDIAVNGYGLVQAYGFVNSIQFSAEADKTVGVTGIAGSFLKAGAVAGTWTSTQAEAALTTGGYKYVQAWATTNISGGIPFTTGFVRAI